MWLLLFLFVSCTPEPSQAVIEAPTETIQSEVIESVEVTLKGVYKRSIGSQYEVYEIDDMLTISIEEDDKSDIIFVSDYTFNDVSIIIDSVEYPYELYSDKIIICGYTYIRQYTS